VRLIVLAKQPRPGFSKTRLQSRWTTLQAAALAEAALVDTLGAAGQVRGVRHVLALDGEPGPWLPAGWEVRPQVDGDLATRICAALQSEPGPALIIGMDTPQVSAAQLDLACRLTTTGATLGLACDGGWWALGLADPARHASLVLGIETSTSSTGARQRERLLTAGLIVADLPMQPDVDTPADALTVAALHPTGAFGRLVRELCDLEASAA
jgi:glycosyltransferase A (GT-A) superfamily protein (DUF2064 family)